MKKKKKNAVNLICLFILEGDPSIEEVLAWLKENGHHMPLIPVGVDFLEEEHVRHLEEAQDSVLIFLLICFAFLKKTRERVGQVENNFIEFVACSRILEHEKSEDPQAESGSLFCHEAS